MTTESALWDWAKSQGPVVLILTSLLVFGYRQFVKFAAHQNAETKAAWDAKEKASESRFADLLERVNASDRRHDECERSKQELQKQIFQMALMTGNEIPRIQPIKTPEEK